MRFLKVFGLVKMLLVCGVDEKKGRNPVGFVAFCNFSVLLAYYGPMVVHLEAHHFIYIDLRSSIAKSLTFPWPYGSQNLKLAAAASDCKPMLRAKADHVSALTSLAPAARRAKRRKSGKSRERSLVTAMG